MDADLKAQQQSLYEDTLAGKVDSGTEDGKKYWVKFFNKLLDCGVVQDIREVEKMFYSGPGILRGPLTN